MKWSIQDHTVRTLVQYCDLVHISLTCKRFHFKDYAVIHCCEQCMVPSSFVPMLQIKKKWKSFKRHGYKEVITAQPEIEFRSLDPIFDCSRSPSQQRWNIRCVWEAYRSCSTCRFSLLILCFSYVLPNKKHRLTEWKKNCVRVKWRWGGVAVPLPSPTVASPRPQRRLWCHLSFLSLQDCSMSALVPACLVSTASCPWS